MACYLLNTAVLTAFGTFRYSGPLSVEEARSKLPADAISAIGHASTAALLSKLLGMPVKEARINVHMRPGDKALVFRLKERLSEGVVLDLSDAMSDQVEWGWLERLE